ncbi:MAG TPA: Smr/MutS family protein [Candidatus Pacearchaeota archaeon]|nr:Smr/MutS family protein [Candidatus Pacearchaeota archaeon]HPM08408.1 Smr/MutS family protein [Candidatus Pacearchaeota archaeon]
MKNNKYEKKIDDEIDLHGYFVDEAIRLLYDFIEQSKKKGFKTIRVITGKGNHSQDGQSPLRDAAIAYLGDKYEWVFDKSSIGPNSGALIIKI